VLLLFAVSQDNTENEIGVLLRLTRYLLTIV